MRQIVFIWGVVTTVLSLVLCSTPYGINLRYLKTDPLRVLIGSQIWIGLGLLLLVGMMLFFCALFGFWGFVTGYKWWEK